MQRAGDRHAHVASPLGELTLIARDMRIAGIYFPDHAGRPDEAALGELVAPDSDMLLAAAGDQLGEYFAGERTCFDLPLYLAGSDFQRRVWQLVATIGYGCQMTYRQLAALLGMPGGAQSVGQAVRANPLSIVIPCHRVIGKAGLLRGYAGGVWRKQFLLELEESEEEKLARLF